MAEKWVKAAARACAAIVDTACANEVCPQLFKALYRNSFLEDFDDMVEDMATAIEQVLGECRESENAHGHTARKPAGREGLGDSG